MIRVILLCAIVVATSPLVSQPVEKPAKVKTSEIGLALSSLNSFGLTFRFGNVKGLWRFNSLLLTGNLTAQNLSDSVHVKTSQMGSQVTAGREYRKPIGDRFALRGGGDLVFSWDQNVYDRDDTSIFNNDFRTVTTSYLPGINIVLGFNYALGERLLLGLEVLPHFTYSIIHSKTTSPNFNQESTTTSYSYGLDTDAGRLSLVFKLK